MSGQQTVHQVVTTNMPHPTLTETLAAFAVEHYLSPHLLAAPVRERAVERIMDNIGCIVFGHQVPPARRTVDLVTRNGRGNCPVIGLEDGTTSATASALAHGILAQSFELNDLGAYVHAGACVIPACLAALSETRVPVSGAQFVVAVSVGYEITVRLAEAIGAGAELDIGWHTPGFHGAVGASAAAALLLGHDRDGVARSLAIAADLAGGGLMVARLGADTKRLHCGRGAETGVFAALLAGEELVARLDVLEHPQWGYCRAMAGGRLPDSLEALTRGLGSHWVGFDRTAIKYYCVGAEVLGVLDNIKQLKSREGFRLDDIESITVGTPKFFVLAEAHQFPASPTEVHFNVEYGVAMALLYRIEPVYEGGIDLLRLWMRGYENPEVRSLSERVHHVVDEELERHNPYSVDSKVVIQFSNGQKMEQETSYVQAMESKASMRFAPMDSEKIRRKFTALTQEGLAPAPRDALLKVIEGLATTADAKDLWRALEA